MNIKTIFYNQYLDDIPEEFLQYTSEIGQDEENSEKLLFASQKTVDNEKKIGKNSSEDNSDFLFVMMVFLLLHSGL